MTTIAYRDKIIAADSRAYSGDKHPIGYKQKIHKLDDGSLVGASSNKVGETDRFVALYKKLGVEGDYEKDTGVQAIVVKPNGEVFYFCDNQYFSGPISGEYIAIGSGEKYAYAAMLMGADAIKAIEISIECDVWSGGEVRSLKL